MKKKALSLALALALCLGLTVPALAADTLTGNQLYPAGDWGNGPTLTLKGVVGERETPNLELSHCYDVAVGGSLVLDMPYPAGKNRDYVIMPAYTAAKPNFEPAGQEPGDVVDPEGLDNWEIPKSFEGGLFEASSGKSQYVYNFTEADMARGDGYEKIIYMHIGWEDSVDGSNYSSDSGAVYFYIHVVPAQPAQPQQPADPEPTTPPAEAIPASGTAQASTQAVEVDGNKVEFQMYALLDENGNSTNYVKLRDLAHVLNGTAAQFSVGYDGTISLTTGQAYEDTGSEMTTPFSGDRAYTGGGQSVKINGSAVEMTAINLLDDNGGGYNYFKLRDLGAALGFNVSWSAERGIFVETDKPYAG